MEVTWRNLTAEGLYAARQILFGMINYENEESKRLTVVDNVLQGVDGLVGIFGPWDLNLEDYSIRDILGNSMEMSFDSGSGFLIRPGLHLMESTQNLLENARFADDLSHWTMIGTFTRVEGIETPIPGVDTAVYVSNLNDDKYLSQLSALGGGSFLTFSCYVRRVDGNAMESMPFVMYVNGSDLGDTMFYPVGGGWYRAVTTNNVDGDEWAKIWFYQDGAWYITGLQVEQKTYPTEFCDGALGPGHGFNYFVHPLDSYRNASNCSIQNTDLVGVRAIEMVFEFDFPQAPNDISDHYILNDGDLKLYWSSVVGTLNFFVTPYYGFDPNFTPDGRTLYHLVISWENNQMWFVLNGQIIGEPSACPDYDLSELFVGWDGTETFGNIIIHQLRFYTHLDINDAIANYAAVTAGINPRFVNVIPLGTDAMTVGSEPVLTGVTVPLVVDGDVRYRNADGADFWRISGDTGRLPVTNGGSDDAYPRFKIVPKAAKTAGFQYRRWVPVTWNSDQSVDRYPCLIATGLDLSGKAQADGDDVRIYDGVDEIYRWLTGTLVSSLGIWTNLDFSADVSMTLKTAIAGSGSISEIEVNEDIGSMPGEGILLIGSEAFTYTSRNSRLKKFYGVTRAARGTSEAAHSGSAAVRWIQHDLWIYYGDASLSAPATNDTYKPIFDVATSSNTTWNYNDFGWDDGSGIYGWVLVDGFSLYTANHGGSADPWSVFGIYKNGPSSFTAGAGRFYNPVGILGINVSTAEYKSNKGTGGQDQYFKWLIEGSTGGVNYYTESSGLFTTDGNWHSWSSNVTFVGVNIKFVKIGGMFHVLDVGQSTYVEFSTVAVALDSSHTPSAAVGAEQGNYQLDCTIENETTGESIVLAVGMQVDDVLIVDTDLKTISLNGMGANSSKTLSSTRRDWLRLAPGANVLTFGDVGTVQMDIDISFDERWIE
jgi:hypothetical protein